MRLFLRMKKILLLTTVILGTAAASHAGVSVHIGIPLPPLPHIVIGRASPPVIVHEPPVVYAPPAPVVVHPPMYCAPPPVVYLPRPRIFHAPPPRVVYSPGYYYHGR